MEEFSCSCGKPFKSKGALGSHIRSCDGSGVAIRDRRMPPWVCSKCNFDIKTSREKHQASCDGRGPRRKKPKNPDGHKWALGLTKETDDRIAKNALALKESYASGKTVKRYLKATDETKEKMRQGMLNRYASGWESKCGRTKKIDYESPVAGLVKLDGSWELKVAQYLDNIGVKWERNKKRFPYWNLIKGKESTYCPDFYVEDWGAYIEVKGFVTDLDICKWIQFKDVLYIWDKTNLIVRKIL
jgi:hypothetical protein